MAKAIVLHEIPTVAALRLYVPAHPAETYQLLGYLAPGDGGQGSFRWDAASTATDDGGTCFAVAGVVTGRWLRVYDAPIDPRWYGAYGDGSHGDSTAFARMISLLPVVLPWSYDGTTVTFERPILANVAGLYPATKPANGLIAVSQPDVPRKVQVRVVSAAATNDITGGVLLLVGTGTNDEVVADIFDLVTDTGAGTTYTYTSDRVFKTITKGYLSGVTFGVGGGAGSTVSIGVASALGLPVARPPVTVVTKSFTQKLILPMYFWPGYPSDGWGGNGWNMVVNEPRVGMIIWNPSTGPHLPADEVQYRPYLTTARANGIKCLGYTYSSWGYPTARPIADVKDDIDKYYAWYGPHSGLDGIFVDEVNFESDSYDHTKYVADQAYYTELRNYVKAKDPNAIFMMNAGGVQDHSCLNCFDICAEFESTSPVFDWWPERNNQWLHNIDASRSTAFVHTCPTVAEMQAAVKRAKSLNMGWITVTNDSLPGAYSVVPSYFYELLDAIDSVNAESIPSSLAICTAANDIGYLCFDMKYVMGDRNVANKYRRIYLDTDCNPATGGPMEGASTRRDEYYIGSNYLIETNPGAAHYAWSGSAWPPNLGNLTTLINTFRQLRLRVSRASFGNTTAAMDVVLRTNETYGGHYWCRHSPVIHIPAMGLPVGGDAFSVSVEKANGSSEVVGALDLWAGSIVPTTLPNGATKFIFTYAIAANP